MKPKKVTSWRVCPECGSRAGKIFHINTNRYYCHCGHDYAPPVGKGKKDGLGWFRFITYQDMQP